MPARDPVEHPPRVGVSTAGQMGGDRVGRPRHMSQRAVGHSSELCAPTVRLLKLSLVVGLGPGEALAVAQQREIVFAMDGSQHPM